MNRCKYCGKPLTLTPEYDTCIECQGRIMREATMPQNSFTTNLKKLSMNIYDDLLKIIEEAKVHNIHQDYFGCVQFEEALEHAKKEHTELEALKRYPTSDEVCKALSEYLKTPVEYNETLGFIANKRVIIYKYLNNVLSFSNNYQPEIHTLIGRFYEGLEKGEVE